jgi:hypothetical protein
MPGTVIGKSLNLGYAGKISRNAGNIVSARMVKSILGGGGAETLSPIPFGSLVLLNADNTYSLFGQAGAGVATAVAANIAGIAVGEVRQVVTYGGLANDNGLYAPTESADVLEIGSCTVFIEDAAANAPTAGGKVYVCSAAGDGTLKVGEMYAAVAPTGIGTGTVIEIPNMRFTSGKVDANGICEISILTRVNP